MRRPVVTRVLVTRLPSDEGVEHPVEEAWDFLVRSALVATSPWPDSGESNLGCLDNPARTFGPDLVGGNFTGYRVYVAGPLAGAMIAVAIVFLLRVAGGGRSGSGAAQVDLFTGSYEVGKS